MEEYINKSYYAVIPAPIRYDKDLSPNSKLLYGEITALCNDKGFCWATNEYFSQLFDVSEVSISKWVNSLIKKNYIASEMIYIDGKTYRHLTIVYDSLKEKLNTSLKEKFKHNNTNNITKKLKENNTKESQEQSPLNSQNEQVATTEDLEIWFSKTYELYPRKVGKIQAKKTFTNKLKKLSREVAKKKAVGIYKMLQQQIKLWSQENDFQGRKLEHIPYFSTWLNANVEDSKK